MSERPPLEMVRWRHSLVPADPMDMEALEAFPIGKPLKVRVARGRSNPQLRLYWALLGKLAENLDQDVGAEDLHEWLKLKLGYTHPVRLRSGEIVDVARSVAFDKMEQAEFNAYFDRAALALVEHIIPAMHMPAFEREARLMLGEPVSTAARASAGGTTNPALVGADV